MIGYLEGIVIGLNPKSALIQAGSIGYIVYITTNTQLGLKLGQTIALKTHLIVKEDALDLYGFTEDDELAFFKLLVGISGIGPRSALAILSLAPPESLRQAVLSGQTDYLTKISGIGKKSAAKIILELKDKLGTLTKDNNPAGLNDLIDALLSLGYNLSAIRLILPKIEPKSDLNTQIKLAIKLLSQH